MYAMSIWVHHAFQGNWWGPFLPGSKYGIPQTEQTIGMYPTSELGWDGQFYLYQSNNLTAIHDVPKNPGYESFFYKNIGFSILARAASLLVGKTHTIPLIYHILNILCICIGFYALMDWLKKNNKPIWHAYAWPLSIGVLNTLFFGVPTAAAESMLIISLIAISEKNFKKYLAASTIMVLINADLISIAAIIAILSLIKKVDWKNWKQRILTLLPIIISSQVILYYSIIFNHSPYPTGFFTYPLIGIWNGFLNAVQMNEPNNVLMLEASILIILISSYICWKNKKNEPLYLAILAYIFFIISTSLMSWNHYYNYSKLISPLIAIIIFSLPFYYKKWIQILLIFIIIHGTYYTFEEKKSLFYTQWQPIAEAQASEVKNEKPLTEFKAIITAPKIVPEWNIYTEVAPPFKLFHQEQVTVAINITNNSSVPWYRFPEGGMHAIVISYRWYDESGTKLITEGVRTPLTQTILPGETVEIPMRVNVPRIGKYLLRIGIVQEGITWFHENGEGHLDLAITVN